MRPTERMAENITIKDRVVRFSGESVLVVLLHSDRPCVESGWYCKSDLDSFKALFELSVAEIRVKFSRGGVDALTANEILGLEKKLTQRVRKKALHQCYTSINSNSSRFAALEGIQLAKKDIDDVCT
jgi:hypothetical protein